jgi:hypothetical protein
MKNAHRSGLWICLAIPALILVEVLVLGSQFLTGANQGPEGLVLWQSLLLLAMIVLGVCGAGWAFWNGWSWASWYGLATLVILAGLLVGFAYWRTTGTLPESVNIVERAKIHGQARTDLIWMSGWGGLNLVLGGMLFVPAVGRFLTARRENPRPMSLPLSTGPTPLSANGEIAPSRGVAGV